MQNLILLFCIAVLSTVLMYTSDLMLRFSDAATQVHCEKREDFLKCSQEFKEKIIESMRKK